jgi:AcrR family transcriptional regulator
MPRPADPTAKDALIASARAEFARRGLRGARVEDITAACDLSKGAFYLHFASKEALLGDLVRTFQERIGSYVVERERRMAELFASHGPLSPRDFEEKTAGYRELVSIDTSLDLATLETMWEFRDVVGVLVRGCQGTPFEGTIWEMVDSEIARCRQTFETMQGQHTCRTDIPGELFGSLIVGTYLLLAVRMSRMEEKPDLLAWARSLHTLIHEGSRPQPQPSKL